MGINLVKVRKHCIQLEKAIMITVAKSVSKQNYNAILQTARKDKRLALPTKLWINIR